MWLFQFYDFDAKICVDLPFVGDIKLSSEIVNYCLYFLCAGTTEEDSVIHIYQQYGCPSVKDAFVNRTLFKFEFLDKSIDQMLVPPSTRLATAVEVLLELQAMRRPMDPGESQSARKLHE
jgi:hypothetical protein